MKQADHLQTFSERMQKYALKWLIFIAMGIFVYAVGLYIGIREQHQEMANKIRAENAEAQVENKLENNLEKKPATKSDAVSGSSSNPGNTEDQK